MGKITIELVPYKQHKENARTILDKHQWNKIRHWCYQVAGFKCEACGADNTELHAHEVWDYGLRLHLIFGFIPWLKWTQRLVEIKCLCEMCHLATHIGFAGSGGNETRLKQAEAQLKRVNGWSNWRMKREVDSAYRQVRRLNKREWTLDISYAYLVLQRIMGL